MKNQINNNLYIDKDTNIEYSKEELFDKICEYHSFIERIGKLLYDECLEVIKPIVNEGRFIDAKKEVGKYFRDLVDSNNDPIILAEKVLLMRYILIAENGKT